jgi:hypothetical protein
LQPHKSTPQDLFSKPARYMVPIFQRGYVWTLRDQIKPLWRDILYQAQKVQQAVAAGIEPERKHFLGAIVVKTDGSAGARHVPRAEVIDGQQRLTTLQVLLIALRDSIASLNDVYLTQKLEGLTINDKVAEQEEAYKVWPTSAFQEEFARIAIARNAIEVRRAFPGVRIGRSRTYTRPLLVQAYLFFSEVIAKYLRGEDYVEPVESGDVDILDDLILQLQQNVLPTLPNGAPIDLPRAELLIDVVTNHLQIIELRLESQDDAQIIFETLNARGAPLKPGDLVRNFVFLQAARRHILPEPLYQSYWKQFDEAIDPRAVRTKKNPETRFWRMEERQGRLTSVRLDLLLFHYLVLRRQSEFKFTHLYQVFREWWEKAPQRDIPDELRQLGEAADNFRELIERNRQTRFGLFAHRLRVLDTTTIFPLVLLLKEREAVMGRASFEVALTELESYLIRRMICRLTPKAYNRVFLSVLQAVAKTPAEDSGRAMRQELLKLSGDTQNWPTDAEVESKFLHDDAYLGLRAGRVQMILEGIELSLDTSRQEARPVFSEDRMPSVEHLWPQRGDLRYWPVGMESVRPDVSSEEVARCRRIIQTFGNLTLLTQPLNSAIGNGPWNAVPELQCRGKREEIVRTSTLRLNQYLRDAGETWDTSAIEKRGKALFAQFKKVWPLPTG